MLHVACAVDGAYDVHSAAMLHSVSEHAGELHVHYLHGQGFPQRSATLIADMLSFDGARVSFVEIAPEKVAELPVIEMFTAAMWYRIFLPELLPDVARVLYLDVDTIVADSLEPLLQVELDGYYLAAVTNVFMPWHVHRPAELGLEADRYFNSGVLLMNLDEMRRGDCTARLRECAVSRAEQLEWPDQDALNLVLGERRLALHPRWNYMNSMRTSACEELFGEACDEARAKPAIHHFEGPGLNKPWNYMYEGPGRELYRQHRRATPWPRVRLEDRTLTNVARRLLRPRASNSG